MDATVVFVQLVKRKLAEVMNAFQLEPRFTKIFRQRAVIVTQTGRVDGEVLETREDFSSERAAKRAIKKRVAELRRRGFHELTQPELGRLQGHHLRRDQTVAVVRITREYWTPTKPSLRPDEDWRDASNTVRLFATLAELSGMSLDEMTDICLSCASPRRWAATARWFAGDSAAPEANLWWSHFRALMEPVARFVLACPQRGLSIPHEELQGAAGVHRGYGAFQRAGTAKLKRWIDDVRTKWGSK